MINVKNIDSGPRGIHTVDGPLMLAAGAEIIADMTEAEIASSEKTGWFAFTRSAPLLPTPPEGAADLDKLSDDELRAFLTDRGIKADGRWQRERLLVEAEKAKAAA